LRYVPLAFESVGHAFYEEGSAVALLYKGERLGVLGRVRESVLEAYGISGPVFAAEIELGLLLGKKAGVFAYEPAPKVPAVVRDLSFLVDRGLAYQDIKSALERADIPHLESFDVIDRYAGPHIPADKTSLSIRFVFRNPRATLLTEDADRSELKILKTLKSTFEIQLREGGVG
jgi:phenylalanyl-tRNA synthetase beta chain